MAELAAAAWLIFWREELPYLLLTASLTALLLGRLLRGRRDALRNTLVFLAVSLVAEFSGALVEAAGNARAGTIVRDVAIVATGLAVIHLAGLALFRAVLPAAGLRTPRIVEDIALVLAYVGWGHAPAASRGPRPGKPRDDPAGRSKSGSTRRRRRAGASRRSAPAPSSARWA